jgi:hypothetical protein
MNKKLNVVCYQCKKGLRHKEGIGDKISHTICPICLVNVMKEIKDYRRKNEAN